MDTDQSIDFDPERKQAEVEEEKRTECNHLNIVHKKWIGFYKLRGIWPQLKIYRSIKSENQGHGCCWQESMSKVPAKQTKTCSAALRNTCKLAEQFGECLFLTIEGCLSLRIETNWHKGQMEQPLIGWAGTSSKRKRGQRENKFWKRVKIQSELANLGILAVNDSEM